MTSRDYKIVRMPERASDGTIQFAVTGLDGEIIDKGRGAGYVSPVSAHRSYGWKQRNLAYGFKDFRLGVR